jgi:aryl-phospho-beta-D-glucosidase BglC (GH1 family)
VQPAWVLDEGDFKRLAALPGNVVRYDFNHELFAEDNPQRGPNLDKLVSHIERLGAIGIGVILDLLMPVGLDVQSDIAERKKPWAIRERTLIEDAGFIAETVSMWTYLAQRLATQPTLVAYELYNEPRAPCDAEGGVAKFQRKSEELARAIRNADCKHLVLAPEYHSRDANPGESYPNPNGKGTLIDSGEQGIRWDHGLVKIDVPNVGYVFHFYEPWSFAGEDSPNFSPAAMEKEVVKRVKSVRRAAARHDHLELRL